MIKLLDSGTYKLVETINNQKALILDDKSFFLWKNTDCDGQLKYIKFDPAQICCMLSINNYRLYDVASEPNLKNGIHLELYAGRKRWQPYLLRKGVPTTKNKNMSISKIEETITKVRKNNKQATF